MESIAGDAARWYGGLGGVVLAALLATGAIRPARHAAGREGSVVAMFWRDTGEILLVLAGTAGPAVRRVAVGRGWLGQCRVAARDGIVLLATTDILAWKWKREVRRYARQRTAVPTAAPDRRVVSSAVGGLLGCAFGIGIATPRFGLEQPTRKL